MSLRRTIGTTGAASVLLLTGVVSTANPVHAAVVPCGTTIVQTTTLTANVGPCAGTHGIIIGADGITLNLNGYKIIGKKSNGDNAGVLLPGRTGVTVRRGIVQGFDAGVAIFGGSSNRVVSLMVKDNVNDFRSDNRCDMGDGISLTNSDGNTISANTVVNNGPYGGISLIADSDENRVRDNTVVGHNIQSPLGSFCGGTNQDEGIRVEGPAADGNLVADNTVTQSALAGIGIHGNRGCPGVPPAPGDQPPNTNNTILDNSVSATAGTLQSDGIKVLQPGVFGAGFCAAPGNTFRGNSSNDNERHGISIPPTSRDNTIVSNTVNFNGVDGIHLAGPTPVVVGAEDNLLTGNSGFNNGEHDGHDDNPKCDDNVWTANLFGTVNQSCVKNGGGTGQVTGPTP